MLKYVDTDIVFQEFPNEVTLAINLSNCPCRCPGCHSPFLWKDIGKPLDCAAVQMLLKSCRHNITCIGIMGGDAEPAAVDALASYIKSHFPHIKTGWYTGRTIISPCVQLTHFDYIKVGPYLRHLGGLDSPRTNQRMYRVHAGGTLEDITPLFQQTNVRKAIS